MKNLNVTTENQNRADALPAKRSVAHVYVCKFPFDVENRAIYPEERAKEIAAAGSEKVKTQKFYVWKLLEYALRSSFGLDIKSLTFKNKNGKWTCDGCEFSISHCNDVAAVAVSGTAIGVDVELIDPERFNGTLARKISTKREIAELLDSSGEERALKLNEMWTVKEAAFKCSSNKAFVPFGIETSNTPHVTKRIRCGSEAYILTVVSTSADNAQFTLCGVELE